MDAIVAPCCPEPADPALPAEPAVPQKDPKLPRQPNVAPVLGWPEPADPALPAEPAVPQYDPKLPRQPSVAPIPGCPPPLPSDPCDPRVHPIVVFPAIDAVPEPPTATVWFFRFRIDASASSRDGFTSLLRLIDASTWKPYWWNTAAGSCLRARRKSSSTAARATILVFSATKLALNCSCLLC